MVTAPKPPFYKQLGPESGFSILEVMIAGIILFIILVNANKALMLGMAGTRQVESRSEIESQILDDIETIRAVDTGLKVNFNACSSGEISLHLKTKLEEHFKNNKPAATPDWKRDMDNSEPTMLKVTYEFIIPESTGAGATGEEFRVLEINPSFMGQCP